MSNKKTAQELFKNLGFEKEIDCLGIIRYDKKEDEFTNNHVIFECYRFAAWSVYRGKEIETLRVDKRLHKAIKKQIEELGWL